MLEQTIHQTLVRNILIRGAPRVGWFHVPNGGYRTAPEAGILRSMGVRAGVPDMIFVIEGKLHALEIKAEKGRLTEPQLMMIEELKSAGSTCAVGYGLDECLEIMERWGVLRATRVMPATRAKTEGAAA